MNDFDHFVGTGPVAQAHAFDEAALAAWLETHLEGFAGPMQVESFKGGQSNPTYKLVTPSCSYVMRAKPGPAAKGVLVGVVALMLPLPLTMAARILVAWGVKSPHSVPRN